MTHLESVSKREGGITHWVARGPAGMRVEWDARIINEIDDRLIGWQSLEGSTIATAGSVSFRETSRPSSGWINVSHVGPRSPSRVPSRHQVT